MKLFALLKKSSPSKMSIGIILIVVFILNLGNINKFERRLISISDIQQYYTYLPAAIIFQDLSLSYTFKEQKNLHGYVWGLPSPTGKPVIMTSMGLSLLYLPTFLLSHLFAVAF